MLKRRRNEIMNQRDAKTDAMEIVLRELQNLQYVKGIAYEHLTRNSLNRMTCGVLTDLSNLLRLARGG